MHVLGIYGLSACGKFGTHLFVVLGCIHVISNLTTLPCSLLGETQTVELSFLCISLYLADVKTRQIYVIPPHV